MAFRIFQVDCLLKHPFPDSAPSSPQSLPIGNFQFLSPILFLPPEYVSVCLNQLLKVIPRTDEILHTKSLDGDQI